MTSGATETEGPAGRVSRDTHIVRTSLASHGDTARTMRVFRRIILGNYRTGSRDLPWRRTRNTYRILVSEVMLQQTQVSRVAEKYGAFIGQFPDVSALAAAPLREVLKAWQGLGYNRRAVSLRRLAACVTEDYGGRIPADRAKLLRLPGIGPYTASALRVFAFNRPEVMIETNIRTVFLHFFFADRTGVGDDEIRPLVERSLYRDDPRTWYNALMDYGVLLKKVLANPSRRSRHHQRQGSFQGSDRQLRGMALRAAVYAPVTLKAAAEVCGTDIRRMEAVLARLVKDGLLRETAKGFAVPRS